MIIENDSIIPVFNGNLYPSQQLAASKLYDWWKSPSLEATLKGYAGTGKTFLLKHFINIIVDKSFTITAPTHKALRVLEQHVNCKGMTLQSLHGLKPNVDLANFDVDKLNFDTIGTPKMQNYSLIIIDESSMINKELFELNRRRSKEYGVKVLYVGDPLQLPPVKEDESRVFTSIDTVIELDVIIRQKEDNSLLGLFELLRNDIREGKSDCLNYLANNRDGISNDKGYQVLNLSQAKSIILDYFSSDTFFNNIDYVRATSYTNISTNSWNTYIRDNIFETGGETVIIDDLLTSYKTLVDDNNAPIIINSEDYIIDQIRPYRNEYRLDVNCVVLKSAYNLKKTEMLQVLDTKDPDNLQRYISLLSLLRSKALSTGGKKGWYPFHKFKNQILSMTDVEVDGRKIVRELDYGYTSTVHKLQGSTFNNIFIDGQDICQPITKWGKRRPADLNLRNRLLYVALSRASEKAFIKF